MRERGFSLIETVVAMALMTVAVGGVFSLLDPAQGAFATGLEAADVQQRLRVAQNTLFGEIAMAGAGPDIGGQTRALIYFLPPVRPLGRSAVTVVYVPANAAQATLAQDVAGGGLLRVNEGSGCLRTADGAPQPLCGFAPRMTLLIFDDTGAFDTFTVASIEDEGVSVTMNEPGGSGTSVYRGGPPATTGIARVTEAVVRTYSRKAETNQLVYSDVSTSVDTPLVDNVVDLSFEYWGEPRPPLRTAAPIDDPVGPWQTYGPRPIIGSSGAGYPANENCAFAYDGRRHVPRLPVLPAGDNPAALVPLTESQITDGLPAWCPDGSRAHRYDVDLLRIRKIVVAVRVQATLTALRGPAGVLFSNGGTSRTATKWVPDQEVRFQVLPRNLNVGR